MPLDPTDTILLVEALVVPLLAAVDGIENALDHEPGPDKLPKLARGKATATLLWVGVDLVDAETNVGQDDTYSWRVNLYVDLHSYESAQVEMKTVVPKVLRAIREQFRQVLVVGEEPAWLSIRDTSEPPVFNAKQGYYRKALSLRATRVES